MPTEADGSSKNTHDALLRNTANEKVLIVAAKVNKAIYSVGSKKIGAMCASVTAVGATKSVAGARLPPEQKTILTAGPCIV